MNWGKSIVLFMLLFMAFILSMVYVAFTKNADLVSEDYYENELNYDKTKQEKVNYVALNSEIEIFKKPDAIEFVFPEKIAKNVQGTITFFRPDQKKLDRDIELSINENHKQRLDYDNFVEGFYDIIIRWKDKNNVAYYFESSISF